MKMNRKKRTTDITDYFYKWLLWVLIHLKNQNEIDECLEKYKMP